MPATSNPEPHHFQFLAEQMLREYQHALLALCQADSDAERQRCAERAAQLGQRIVRPLAIGLRQDTPF